MAREWRRTARRVRYLCATLAASTANGAEHGSLTADTCSLQPGPSRTVTRIIDGETVALDDGKEVRLIGALSPRARDANAEAGAWPLEEAAKTALAELTLGKRVDLAYGTQREDRYGRHVAHLFITEGGQRLWVQGEMLQLGVARAYGLPADSKCLSELVANEAIARTAGAGVWTSHVYAVRPADKTYALLALRSTFQIVRGTVASITRTKAAVYLNFGADWRSDFTVSIPNRLLGTEGGFSGGALDAMTGRSIEVRGWIERRNGPMVAITSPAAIKLLDGGNDDEAPLAQVGRADTPGDGVSAPAAANPDLEPHTPPNQTRPRRKAPGDVDL